MRNKKIVGWQEVLVLLDSKGNEIARIENNSLYGFNSTYVTNMAKDYKAKSARVELSYKFNF